MTTAIIGTGGPGSVIAPVLEYGSSTTGTPHNDPTMVIQR